jgi:MFS family permease
VERSYFRGHRWLQWLSYAVLICNPLTLDLLCIARGYSLALGFLAFGLLKLLDFQRRHQIADLKRMSLALGLCVAANLAFAFPAIAALGVAAALVLKFGYWRQGFVAVLAPGAIVAFLLLVLPLSKADRNAFYWGASTVADSVETTVNPLFQHRPEDPGPFGTWRTIRRFRLRFVPAAMAILLALALRWSLQGQRQELALLTSVFLLSLFGYWLAHVWLAVPYPSERTSAPVILLFFLTFGGALSDLIRFRWAAALLVAPSAIIFCALLVQAAQQTDPCYQWAWFNDRDNHRLLAAVASRNPKSVSTHWTMQPQLEFYRLSGKLPRVTRRIERVFADQPPLSGHDVYVLHKAGSATVVSAGLREVYRNPSTGMTVAFPQEAVFNSTKNP